MAARFRERETVVFCCLSFGSELVIFMCSVLVIEINYFVKLLSRLTHLLAHECSDSQRVYYSK